MINAAKDTRSGAHFSKTTLALKYWGEGCYRPSVKAWFRCEDYSRNPHVLRLGPQCHAVRWGLGKWLSPEVLPSSTDGVRVK